MRAPIFLAISKTLSDFEISDKKQQEMMAIHGIIVEKGRMEWTFIIQKGNPMTQVKWQFAGNQIYAYDKSTFESTVTALIQRVKPKGFRILNLDFTEKSESVYVVLVSLGTTEYLQFRISSHNTFGKRVYKNYNTNDFTGFVALEKHIENELKQAAGSKKNRLESKITFHYQEEDFIFFRRLGYLTNIKKRFIMVETELVRQAVESSGKKALLVDEHNQVKGCLDDKTFSNEVFAMLGKGFLTAYPISKEFSLIGTTRLYRNLSSHYGIKFMEAAKSLDMETFFSERLLWTDLPLRGTELWPFEHSYFLGNMVKEVQGFLEKRPAQLAAFVSEDKKIEATLIKDGRFLRLHLTPAVTSKFKNMLMFKSDIAAKVTDMGQYEAFTFEHYLVLKLLERLEASERRLWVPKPFAGGLKISGDAPGMVMETLLQSRQAGLFEFLESEDSDYHLVAPTAISKQLFEATTGQFEPLFLEGMRKGTLPDDFVRAYRVNPYELVIKNLSKAFQFKDIANWFARFQTKKPNLVAYMASPQPDWDPANLPAIYRYLKQQLAGNLPEMLRLERLELRETAIEVGLAHVEVPLDFIHFTISATNVPTMMKLFRSDKFTDKTALLEEIRTYLSRVVKEQGHYRHFKYSDYETYRWFGNLKRVGKALKVTLEPDDWHLTQMTSCDLLLEADQSFLLRLEHQKVMGQLRYGILNGLVKLSPHGGNAYVLEPTGLAEALTYAYVGTAETTEEPVRQKWFKLLQSKS